MELTFFVFLSVHLAGVHVDGLPTRFVWVVCVGLVTELRKLGPSLVSVELKYMVSLFKVERLKVLAAVSYLINSRNLFNELILRDAVFNVSEFFKNGVQNFNHFKRQPDRVNLVFANQPVAVGVKALKDLVKLFVQRLF